MQLRIVNGFDHMADAKLLGRANSIVESLSSNFASAPGLPALITARDTFSAAMATAAEGSKYEKVLRNQRKENLVQELHTMSAYIMYISAGDYEIASGSGFSFAKPPSPSPAAVPAQDQQLENGINTGELAYNFKPVPGAKSYVYEVTADPIAPASNWNPVTGTKSKYLFTGLESGKRYWCRVTAIGVHGAPAVSEPLSHMVI